MARKRIIPNYGTVVMNGTEYYRTRIVDSDGKRVALYAKTREELYEKVEDAQRQIESACFRRKSPTVKEYAEKWLLMQSAQVRETTMIDYRSKVKNYIIKPLGHMYMADVTPDDIKLALVPVSNFSPRKRRAVCGAPCTNGHLFGGVRFLCGGRLISISAAKRPEGHFARRAPQFCKR